MSKVQFAFALLFLASCGEGKFSHSLGLAPAGTIIPPETPLAIVGTRAVGAGAFTPAGNLNLTDLKDAMYSLCYAEVEAAFPVLCPNPSSALDSSNCAGHQCMMQVHSCVGHKYMEIANEVNELSYDATLISGTFPTYTLTLGSVVHYKIPPQSAANRTLAYDTAVTSFSLSGVRAVTAIEAAAPNCFTPGGAINSTINHVDIKQDRARIFAATFADTVKALLEASRGYTRNSLQVAGSYRQSERDFGEAGQMLWNGRVNSLRAVAAMMGNRDDGTDLTLDTCTASLLDKPNLQAAVRMQRQVALPVTLGASATESFVTSLRTAFENRNPELSFGEMNNDEFLERFSISRGDVEVARQYLKEEHVTFRRTDLETYTGSGHVAGIATKPQPLPSAAVLTKTAAARVLPAATLSQTQYRDSGVMQMVDYLRWGATRALRAQALPTEILTTMRSAQALAQSEVGRLRVSVVSNGSTTVKVNIHGVTGSEKFVVVSGLDGARCLSEGTVEGAPCEPAGYILDDTATFAAGDGGATHTHELDGTLTYVVTVGGNDLYLLSADGPWTILAGINATGIPGTANALVFTVGGVLHDELADAVLPDPDECGETIQDCVGLPGDLVVPLESELTEDSDPYENSWRHYLDLADQMAREADALGETLIAHGLEGDMRAEGARDELEALCGGVQNVTTQHDSLAARDQSLESCLPDGTENERFPWVTLGATKMCIPIGMNNPNCGEDCEPLEGTCAAGLVAVEPLGIIEAHSPQNHADCRNLEQLAKVGAGELKGVPRSAVIEEMLQSTSRWANRRELASLVSQSLYDENAENYLEVSVGGKTILSLTNDGVPPCANPSADTDQSAALRAVDPLLFDQSLCFATADSDERAEYSRAARRAFATLRKLTGGFGETGDNLRRSWVASVDVFTDCDQDDVDTDYGDCRNASVNPEEQLNCAEWGGCRCLWDDPGPASSYGDLPCDLGAARIDVLSLGHSIAEGGEWVDLWNSEGGIDCYIGAHERPSLELVLCSRPDLRRFSYPWDQIEEHFALTALGDHFGEQDDVTSQDIYSALALGCYMQLGSSGGGCGGFDPSTAPPVPTINAPGDLKQVEDRVACAADAVRSAAGNVLLANVPKVVVDALHSPNIRSLYPQFRGQHLEALVAIQSDLNAIGEHAVALETQLRLAQSHTQRARQELDGIGVQVQIQELQSIARILSIAAEAAAAAFVSFSASTAFAVPQFIVQEEIADLEKQALEIQEAAVLTDYATQVTTVISSIHSVGSALHDSVYRLNADLGRLETIQNRAATLVAQVGFLDEDDVTGKLFPVNSVMRRRYNTDRELYERARDRARQMAFVARRAIEQRFAVNLSSMSEDLTLVEAPAQWARDVCTFEGIDYDRIRAAGEAIPKNYADGYLGEYVRKLQLFVETYPFDFPFQDGSDLAVISLRDDIARSRSECEWPVVNLLGSSDSVLGVAPGAEESLPYWSVSGCESANPSCLFLETRADVVLTGRAASRIADVPFGSSIATGVLSQDVEVPRAGRYLLSWRDRFVTGLAGSRSFGATTGQMYRVRLERVGSGEAENADQTPTGATGQRGLILETTEGGVLRVTIDPSKEATLLGLPVRGDVWVSELQLELLDPGTPDARSGYVATTAPGMAIMALCPDFDGDTFRDKFFERRCERLCAGGFGEGCGDRGERVRSEHCFKEMEFAIDLHEIERGNLIPSGAIALGNFNYRHELVGVNLVGTNVRDCTRSAEPATCYGNAFVPVSLVHAGEAEIRNHAGNDVVFDFGRGIIEHGKALASEVVLTNPLTGSAEGLLQPFYKEEFRGRPLTGHYWVRVWDDPTLNWTNVEDIQLVFRYRYWTRFGE